MAVNITYNNSVLLDSTRIENTDTGKYHKYVSNESIYFNKDIKYLVSYNLISEIEEPFELYITGSSPYSFYPNSYDGYLIEKLSVKKNTFLTKKHIIKADSNGTSSLCFLIKPGTFYISNISVTPYHTFNDSLGEIELIIPNISNKRFQDLSLDISFISSNGNIAGDPNYLLSNAGQMIYNKGYSQFTGSNLLISHDDNLIEGDLYVGKSLRSGVQISGKDGAMVRSLGYYGFYSASYLSNGKGFLLYSGSVLPGSGDSYSGVGLELHAGGNNGYLRYRNDSVYNLFEVVTPNFFFGSANTQYISGSNGLLIISSSNLYLNSSSLNINTQNFFLGSASGAYISGSGGNLSISSSVFNLQSNPLFIRNNSVLWNNSSSRVIDLNVINGDFEILMTGEMETDPGWFVYNAFAYPDSSSYQDNINPHTGTYSYYMDVGGIDTYGASLYITSSYIFTSTNNTASFFEIGVWSYIPSQTNIHYGIGVSVISGSSTIFSTNIPYRDVTSKDTWFHDKFIFQTTASAFSLKFGISTSDDPIFNNDGAQQVYLDDITVKKFLPFVEISSDGFFAWSSNENYIKIGDDAFDIQGVSLDGTFSETFSIAKQQMTSSNEIKLKYGNGDKWISYVPNSQSFEVQGGHLTPHTQSSLQTLGTSTKEWRKLYAIDSVIGGLHERNLQSNDIIHYPVGTVLVWDVDKLIKSQYALDKRVIGVTKDNQNTPIVFGAEYILVTGSVNSGDYLVTSNEVGYAMSEIHVSENIFGKVIGQALESSDGNAKLIKAFIKKM